MGSKAALALGMKTNWLNTERPFCSQRTGAVRQPSAGTVCDPCGARVAREMCHTLRTPEKPLKCGEPAAVCSNTEGTVARMPGNRPLGLALGLDEVRVCIGGCA